ncbi:MAG: phenylacetate--CoA ligase family protein [Chloroflexi bacterium]|nr:phenylacetate--CoA ligase family protein [Chloroflexota bacterium]
MNFENWIHDKICQATGKSNVTRSDIESYQLQRLNHTLGYVKENSPFYRDLLADVAEIRSLNEISRIPFTNPLDLEQSPYKLLCVSTGGIARIFSHFTTGTMSGRPKKIFFTYNDAEAIVDSMAAIMETVIDGVGLKTSGCKVHIFLPNNGPPMSMAGLISRGVEQLGGIPIVGDCTAMTPEQIEQIEETKPNMLMGSAFRIWRITQKAREPHNLASIGVKAVFVTSEYLSRAMRERLEEYWQAEVFHHYGMTEPGFVIGVECRAHDGFHFNETQLLFEVVDPETGQVLGDGEEGELVFTTLQRDGMPLIRYRTGDVASLRREPCGCGASTLTKIGTLPKRVGLIVKIGDGEQIYTSLFDEVLYQIPELIDYRIFIDRDGDVDALNCKVEVLGNPSDIEERALQQLLAISPVQKSVQAGLLANPVIELVERGVLRRGGRRMKRRIVDNRA